MQWTILVLTLISGQEAHPSYATQVGYYLQQSQPRIPTTQQINPAQTVSLKVEMKGNKSDCMYLAGLINTIY